MTKKTVSVTVDIREPPEVSKVVSEHPDVEKYVLDELDSGDILIEGVVIERKTPSDFASSMTDRDDHLKSQVERMNDQYDESYVLLEGGFTDFGTLSHSQVPAKSLRGFAASITARYGTPVLPCDDLDTLVDMAIRLARKHIEDSSGDGLRVKSSVDDQTAPATKRMYGCIDGVGAETAEKMYRRYPALPEAIEATALDWEAIDGIGEVTAATIRDTLNGDVTEGNWEVV